VLLFGESSNQVSSFGWSQSASCHFKDDVLIPYREEITNIIRLQDENSKQVHVQPDFFIDPETTYGLQNITLYDLYGPLARGIYRVIIRHHFEMGWE
jgi:hypothetical protein